MCRHREPGGIRVMSGEVPLLRTYVHKKCRRATVVSGDDFVALADPFSRVSWTQCAPCQCAFRLDEFVWQGSGEGLVEARRRVAREHYPWLLRFINSNVFYLLL